MDESERHFVLVHGAGHGAWCWYKVATLLKQAGHRVTALDMAASGVHPKQVNEVRSMKDYFQPLMEFMESLPVDDWVVLVGHSAGGISISAAMERFPEKIVVAVFVASFMHGPDLNLPCVFRKVSGLLQQVCPRVSGFVSLMPFSFHLFRGALTKRTIFPWNSATPMLWMLNERSMFVEGMESWMDSQHKFDNGLEKPPTSLLWGPNHMQSKLYNRSPPEDLTLATMLVRPHPFYDEAELVNDTALTKENYGSVRRVYVMVEEDCIIKEEFQRWLIANNPTDEVKVISGADHMVMFSKPQELSSCLLGLAAK